MPRKNFKQPELILHTFPYITLRVMPLLLLLILVGLGIGITACNREDPVVEPAGQEVSAGEAASTTLPDLAVRSAQSSVAATEVPNQNSKTLAEKKELVPTPLVTTPQATHKKQSPEKTFNTARQSFEYGNTALARAQLAALLDGPTDDPLLFAQIYFLQAKSYLTDGLYTDALATLGKLTPQGTFDNPSTAESAEAIEEDPLQEIQQQAIFLQGQALLGLGRYAEAIRKYEQFEQLYPWSREVVEQKIASAYLALGNHSKAATAYHKALGATEDRVARVVLLEALAQTNLAMERYSDVVAAYDEILSLAKNSGYRAEVAFLAAQALASAGNEAEAVVRWQSLIDEFPSEPGAYKALIELVNRDVPVDQFQRGTIDLAARAWFPAINAFQSYLDNISPTDDRAGAAMLGLGQAYLGAGDNASARTVFQRLITAYPECECIGRAQLDLAGALSRAGNTVEAKRLYRTFARENQTDALAPDALWQSGLLAYREGNELEAAVDFFALADLFPQSEWTPLALYIVGLGAYREGLYSQAVTVFERLRSEYPAHSRHAVQYWLGRAYHGRGDARLARVEWLALVDAAPDAYYGVLSALALQQPSGAIAKRLDAIEGFVGPPSRLADDDGSQNFAEEWLRNWFARDEVIATKNISFLPEPVAADPDLRLGKMLLNLDQRVEALALFERVFNRYKKDPAALYALGLEFERLRTYRLSLICMENLFILSSASLVEEIPLFLQKRIYPRHFDRLVEAEAIANEINPLLFFSLIRQESQFEQGARSHAAAQGLVQMIPDTGEWVATRLNYPNYSNDLVYRPYVNIKFGAYYLDWIRDFLDDNLFSALAGYNAGPGNAQAWRKISGPDDALFVETFTVNEPRIYIQKILSNLYHYHRLYGTKNISSK